MQDEFADCLNRNLAELRNSSVSVLRLLAENFDFYQLKSRMSKVCNELPGKCGRKTKKVVDSTCSIKETNCSYIYLNYHLVCSTDYFIWQTKCIPLSSCNSDK